MADWNCSKKRLQNTRQQWRQNNKAVNTANNSLFNDGSNDQKAHLLTLLSNNIFLFMVWTIVLPVIMAKMAFRVWAMQPLLVFSVSAVFLFAILLQYRQNVNADEQTSINFPNQERCPFIQNLHCEIQSTLQFKSQCCFSLETSHLLNNFPFPNTGSLISRGSVGVQCMGEGGSCDAKLLVD